LAKLWQFRSDREMTWIAKSGGSREYTVVGSFEPSNARAACDGICRHFARESYLLKVW
jgi:hypothetical protein